jgi:phage N-6-adenine-methyltransferase
MNKELFTSEKQDWETPQWLFDKLDKHFKFSLDVCATKYNHKCKTYIDPQMADGLICPWDSIDFGIHIKHIFCNPPYNQLSQWIKKCYEESLKGCTVVMLIPARTDTKVWHEYVSKGRVTLLKGRLKFSNSKHSAPFPSCIVVFGKEYDAGVRNQKNDFLFNE